MSARIIDSYQNQVFDVFATSGHYVVKYYEDELMRKRKMQVDVSRKWQAEGINCILPIGDFYKGERGYYVIYEYFDNEQRKSLNDDDIKKLAQIQAKMHKLDVSSTLPCDYRIVFLLGYNLWACALCLLISAITYCVKIDNAILQFLGKYGFEIYILQRIPDMILQPYLSGYEIPYFLISFSLTLLMAISYQKVLGLMTTKVLKTGA